MTSEPNRNAIASRAQVGRAAQCGRRAVARTGTTRPSRVTTLSAIHPRLHGALLWHAQVAWQTDGPLHGQSADRHDRHLNRAGAMNRMDPRRSELCQP
jgi:hypothetical protein